MALELIKTIIFLISLIIVIVDQFNVAESCAECNMTNITYTPPCNMKYPYGDENEMGADVTMNDTLMIVCEDRIKYVPEYGRCPFPPEDPNDMKLTDPYIHCPEFPVLPTPGYKPEGAPLASTSALCQSCDVKLAPDGAAVNLKCVGCHDLPDAEFPINKTEKELIYTVYYVEIANYTSVDVQGRENLNP